MNASRYIPQQFLIIAFRHKIIVSTVYCFNNYSRLNAEAREREQKNGKSGQRALTRAMKFAFFLVFPSHNSDNRERRNNEVKQKVTELKDPFNIPDGRKTFFFATMTESGAMMNFVIRQTMVEAKKN